MMNSLISRLLFFLFLSLFFNGCSKSSKESVGEFKRNVTTESHTFTIPKEIKDSLLQHFSEAEIINKEAYSNLFWDFYDRTVTPNECFTDINNDQIMDYALLVKEKNNLKVIIAFSTKKGYSYWISPFSIEKINTKGVNFCVTIKPAGRTDVVKKKPESLVLKNNGFLLKNLEQDYLTLYEADNKIMIFKML
ncbi:hypothetical protein [Flavobacterium sp. WC2509]|uniref:hypothetical protein n=1 Tax=Flavobacterium sp. WC2509 TaxID=3461406 RepID=UPI004043C584